MEHNPASGSANLARTTLRGTLWTYLASYGGKGMIFVSTIVLARLLAKDDFGVAGYALTTIAFLDVLSDLGVGAALIYHRDDLRAADTAFWLGVAISAALFGLAWFIAPLAGAFFNDDRAIPVTRALALTFPIFALGNVHDMLLRKRLEFGRKIIPDFVQATSKGLFSITFALMGMGAWSLIWGHVVGHAISVIVYWWISEWRPSLRFVTSLARALLSYGLGMVSVEAVTIIVTNIDYLFVGRFLGAAALGVYTLAFRLPELVVMQFCSIISRVVFPVFAKMRDDPITLRQGFIVSTRYVVLITVPLALGLALVAEPFILTVYSNKWADAIPVMRAIAIYTLFLSLGYNAGDVYKAQGRPMVLTWITAAQGVILIPVLYWAATGVGSIAAIGWTHAVVAFITAIVYLAVALRMLDTPLGMLIDAFRPAAIAGTLMSLAVLSALMLVSAAPSWVQLIVSSAVGALAYLGALWVLQRNLMLEASSTLRAAFLGR